MDFTAPPPPERVKPVSRSPRRPVYTFIARHGMAIRWVSAVLGSVALLLILIALPLETTLRAIGQWVADLGPWAPLVFALLMIAGVLVFLPKSFLSFSAGAILGFAWGFLIAWLGALIGATIAMFIGRALGRAKVADFIKHRPIFRAIDHAVSRGGWKIVVMLRMAPVVPYSVQSYLYGLTGIRLRTALSASFFATIPCTFMVVYFGDVVGDLARTGVATADELPTANLGVWVVRLLGLLATVGVTVYLTQLAQQALAEMQQDTDSPDEGVLVEPQPRGPLCVRRTLLILALALVLCVAAAVLQFNPLH